MKLESCNSVSFSGCFKENKKEKSLNPSREKNKAIKYMHTFLEESLNPYKTHWMVDSFNFLIKIIFFELKKIFKDNFHVH